VRDLKLPPLRIRRLAAVDMHGATGTSVRRRLIVAEFLLGAAGGTALGLFIAISTSTIGWLLFGLWLTGVCLNYVPLALHALLLSRSGRLEAELAGVDISHELRHYTRAQFWIAVPLLFVILAPVQRR
jgi:hypothetical protein